MLSIMSSLLPFRRLISWGPLVVFGIIKVITWAMVHLLSMYWPPGDSLSGAINMGVFLILAAKTLYYYLQTVLAGPGYVPLGWKPDKEEDVIYLQYCTECRGYKAPRSHHCRKCGRCILKMDHHCPWVSTCVGHANHGYFNRFLLCAVLGCLQATVLLSLCIWSALLRPRRPWWEQSGAQWSAQSGVQLSVQSGVQSSAQSGVQLSVQSGAQSSAQSGVQLSVQSGVQSSAQSGVQLSVQSLLGALFAVGLALGVVLAVGCLLYFQIRGVLRNRTSIEDWILEKAISRHEDQDLPPFVFPYDLGWRKNLRSFLSSEDCDGLTWTVREGCGVYDLTIEQKAQKCMKRSRSRVYSCSAPYSGRYVPILSYPRAALVPPCTDEDRLVLQVGDVVRVTRQKKNWLFGEKLILDAGEGVRGPRGWFPLQAVVLTDDKYKPD